MPDHRFFIPKPLQSHQTYSLQDQEFHHLIHVMRVKTGEKVEIVNGKGELAQGIVQKIEKHQANILVEDVQVERKSTKELILAQAFPKMAKLEYILEKATELGCSQIWIFSADRSDKREISESQKLRMQQILISSMKQCGRLFLPEMHFLSPIKEWKPLSMPAFFGDTLPSALPILEAWKLLSNINQMTWIVGPESGFSPQETEILSQQIKARGVSLHHNILRVDTAAISGLSILSCLLSPN
jgi:16S rRNA (uracil1498-N3)-methyltransferase